MMNESKVKELLGTEVNMEAISTVVVHGSMLALVYEGGFSIGMQKLDTLCMMQQSNDALRSLIDRLDVALFQHKVALLNKVFKSYLEYQHTYSKQEWSVLHNQVVEIARLEYERERDAKYEATKYTWDDFEFITTRKSSIFDWDKLMIKVLSELQKMGILLCELLVKNRPGVVYYYIFNPKGEKQSDCRDFVLTDILLDEYIKKFGHYLTKDLFNKIWSNNKEDVKAIFWSSQGKKLREQLWEELFTVSVCDQDFDEK